MNDVWIKIRKITNDGETMFEAGIDLFPDAAVYENTADEAYQKMRELLPDLVQHYIDTHGYVPWTVFKD